MKTDASKQTLCPFCGAPLSLNDDDPAGPAWLAHGLPVCRELRDAPDATTFLERAAARVVMQRKGQAGRGRAKA